MATIQEILQNQQMGIGQASSDVNFLLKKIAKDMQLAQSQDKQLEQNIKKGGKTFLEGVKTRKDFLLAKRFRPNLTFKDFLLDDRTAAQYMREGVEEIVKGKAPKIGLGETFGFKRGDDYIDTVREKDGFQAVSNGQTTSYSSPMGQFTETNGKRMGVPIDSGYTKKQKTMGVPIDSGYTKKQKTMGVPIDPLLADNTDSEYVGVTAKAPKGKNVISLERGATQEQINAAMEAAKAEKASGVSEATEAIDASGASGTAMKALGVGAGLYGLGSGLSSIFKGKGDLSAVAKTGAGALGIASALGMANPLLGMGLGLLSSASSRRRR